jgi:hypothetical protein
MMRKSLHSLTLLAVVFSVLLIWLLNGSVPAYAQPTNCSAVIANLNQATVECSEINNNWVCYGSTLAEAAPPKYRFYDIRDRREFAVLQELKTVDQNGVVLMNLVVAGKAPMKFILFGAVDVQSVDQSQGVFTLENNGQLLCPATLSGIVVQTARGTTGVVTINGVDIELGSTAYITVQPDGRMVIVNIEGRVKVNIAGVTQALQVGQQSLIAFTDGQPSFVGQPTASPFFASPVVQWLATSGLPRVHNTNETELRCVGEINFGQTITTRNVDPGQECLYKFCAKAGEAVTVQMDALDPSLTPWVDLRGPGGGLVSFNDDINNADLDSLICNRVMPLTSCDYTIVARSSRNDSAGQFTLSLDRRTDCLQPMLRCDVVSPGGTELREGPGFDFAPIQHLPNHTHLHPLERSVDGAWTHVQVLEEGQQGWVDESSGVLECEDDSGLQPIVEPLPEPVIQPPSRKKDNPSSPPPCPKCGPFGAP